MILLVAQLELSSLRNVVRLIHCLGGEEDLADKVQVVINRVGCGDGRGGDQPEEGRGGDRQADLLADPERPEGGDRRPRGRAPAGQARPEEPGPAEHRRPGPGALRQAGRPATRAAGARAAGGSSASVNRVERRTPTDRSTQTNTTEPTDDHGLQQGISKLNSLSNHGSSGGLSRLSSPSFGGTQRRRRQELRGAEAADPRQAGRAARLHAASTTCPATRCGATSASSSSTCATPRTRCSTASSARSSSTRFSTRRFGFGPLEVLLKDPTISDILINGPHKIYVERRGKLEKTDVKFRDNDHLLQIIDRIVSKVGRRVDETIADGGRPLAGRLPRQRHHPAARPGRPERVASAASAPTR